MLWPIVLLGLFLQACQPGQMPAPAPLPTAAHALQPGPGGVETSVAVNCEDEALHNSGDYRIENNTWGKGNLSGWSQCIGIGSEAGGAITARWNWDWLNSGDDVKAYPEIIFGQKPGGTTTSKALPILVSNIGRLTVSYEVTSLYSGSGNTSFDLWLTNTPDPATFGAPPITREIMIWIDHQGALAPGGSFEERVSLNGSTYAVFVAPKWGAGWEYVAFISQEPQLGSGTLDLGGILTYMQEKDLATGAEYLASIEFGNEIATGSGETTLKSYSVSLTPK